MIEITDIPDWCVLLAKKRAEKLGILRNSITNGEGNIVGYLGQIIITRYLKAEDVDMFDYDVMKKGIRYEVKTKRCNSKPLMDYDCSVYKSNATQQCDYYVFVRVLSDFSKAWILGKKSPEQYFKQARFCKKGEYDIKSNLGFLYKGDSYNLAIKELDQI